MFWVYRYKGFSFTAARTVHTALVLAGQQRWVERKTYKVVEDESKKKFYEIGRAHV